MDYEKIYYVQNISFLLIGKILLFTIVDRKN